MLQHNENIGEIRGLDIDGLLLNMDMHDKNNTNVSKYCNEQMYNLVKLTT